METNTTLNGSKRGRRRGRRGQSMPTLDRARAIIRPLMAAGKPFQCHELELEHGISHYTFDAAIGAERARLEAVEEAAVAELIAKFSKTKVKAFDVALRAYAKKLNLNFEQRVAAEVTKRFNQAFPLLEKEQSEVRDMKRSYEEFMHRAKKLGTVADWNNLVMCLHPDTRRSASDSKFDDALAWVLSKKFPITGEK